MKPLQSREYQGSKNILNPQRPYVPAAQTNLAELFKRIQQEAANEKRRTA